MKNSNFQAPEKTGERLRTELEQKIALYSRVPHYVLILGERGTGKTTIAKQIHAESGRANREFINLNCASLNEGLLESELFGYEKGAFTGANYAKAGLFEIANGGTLFLDEIGEIPVGLQAKLLKAVEEKRIRRVGSNAERPVDTRIIAATSQNLEQMVAEGLFRADLFDRLNVLKLETIPLRFQKEKIKDLLQESLNRECLTLGRIPPLELSPEALELLELYDWHGNFRELHNFAARASVEGLDEKVISSEIVKCILGDEILSQLGFKEPEPEKSAGDLTENELQEENLITVTFNLCTEDLQQIYIKAAAIAIKHLLAENDGSFRQAAKILRADHTTLSRILAKFDEGDKIKHFPLPNRVTEQFAITA